MLDLGIAAVQRVAVEPLARRLPARLHPNVLTGVRLVLAAAVAGALTAQLVGLAVTLYVAALVSDALDGAVARLRGTTSRFGARFDPAVDKVLQAVVFLAFFSVSPGLFAALLVIDVLLFIFGSFFALRTARTGGTIAASAFGKCKLTFQAVAVLALFWSLLFPAWAVPLPLVRAVLTVALAFAILSFFGYLRAYSTLR